MDYHSDDSDTDMPDLQGCGRAQETYLLPRLSFRDLWQEPEVGVLDTLQSLGF